MCRNFPSCSFHIVLFLSEGWTRRLALKSAVRRAARKDHYAEFLIKNLGFAPFTRRERKIEGGEERWREGESSGFRCNHVRGVLISCALSNWQHLHYSAGASSSVHIDGASCKQMRTCVGSERARRRRRGDRGEPEED